eukprot:Transcript_10200.p1 GENE.Transcript_10200~~Transcript_10200.p1  ORF type:complete len:463 (-),score=201.50 Transcript_10200:1535-2923(-)
MTSYQQLREGLDGASGSADVDTSEPTEDEIKVQVLAKQAYRGQDDELALTFHKGDVLTLLPRRPCASAGMGIAWYQGEVGLVPLAHLEPLSDSAIDAPPAMLLPELQVPEETETLGTPYWPRRSERGLRGKVWLVFTDSESCIAAQLIAGWVMILICVSTAAFVAESLPQFRVDGGPDMKTPWFWDGMETFVVIQFSIEYSSRLLTCPGGLMAVARWVVEPMNVVDLVAIAPWYLEMMGLVGSGSAVLRVFRLARVIRIFKLGKYAAGLQMFSRTLLSSADALFLMAFFLTIATVLFSSMMYFAERGSWSVAEQKWLTDGGDESQFTSIPETFWWCIVTITTVGYGDVVPVTLSGKLVAVGTMAAGVLTIALPVSIVGANFQREYARHQKETKQRKAEKAQRDASSTSALLTPLQQDLGKLGQLFDDMSTLMKTAHDKQEALLRISNSPIFQQTAQASSQAD